MPKIGFFAPKMNFLDPLKFYGEVVKLEPPGPLLSLSAGRKHVGLAISDVAKTKASTFGTLAWNRKDPHLIASELQSLISTHSISGLVVGYPFCHQKRYPARGKLLVDDIIKTGKLKDVYYTFWDETCSTQGRYKMLGLSPKRHPGYSYFFSDTYAAFEYLETYMDLFRSFW